MPDNSKNLLTDQPVDKELKPVKDSNGTSTSMEISTEQVRLKDLKVEESINVPLIISPVKLSSKLLKDTNYATATVSETGSLTLATEGSGSEDSDISLVADGDVIITADDDLTITADEVNINSAVTTSNYAFKITGEIPHLQLEWDASNYCRFAVNSAGVLTLTTVGSGTHDSNLVLQPDGSITLDSASSLTLDSGTGHFITKNAGTEFSVANSSYSGMILGYTAVGIGATPASFSVTDAMLPVHDDLKVTFKAPPSGVVEIEISIFLITSQGRNLTFGLSTTNATTGFTTLHAQYENCTIAVTTHPAEYAPFIMKATALPTAVTDYAVY